MKEIKPKDGDSVVVVGGDYEGQVGVVQKLDPVLFRYIIRTFNNILEIPEHLVKVIDLSKPYPTGEEDSCL